MSSTEYQIKSLTILRKYLPYHKNLTVIAVICFVLFLPSLFGLFIKMGFIGSLLLIMTLILSGWVQIKEFNEQDDLLNEYIGR